MRGQADAAFRLIEAEFLAHRPAQPRVTAAFRRPSTFDQAAEHDAVAVSEARFDGAQNADSRAGARRRPDLASRERGNKQLDIIGGIDDEQRAAASLVANSSKRVGELGAVRAGEGMFALTVARQGHEHIAMMRGDLAQRKGLIGNVLKRRQRLREPADEIGSRGKFVFAERNARIGSMQISRLFAVKFSQFVAERA